MNHTSATYIEDDMGLSKISELKAVILYGSHARGDFDDCSDVDVCIILKNIDLNESRKTASEATLKFLGNNTNTSIYTEREFSAMVKNGSLFAWHLKLEGKLLFSSDDYVDSIFKQIGKYQRARDDANSYLVLVNDISESLSKNNDVNVFDLSMMFTIARNNAMVLSFLGGRPTFGRNDVLTIAEQIYGSQFGFIPDIYDSLLQWKLWYARGIRPSVRFPSILEATKMLNHIRHLTEFVITEAENEQSQ